MENCLKNYKDILTVDDICEILHISKVTAYRLIKDDEIPYKKIRKKYIIPKFLFINWLHNQNS